MSRSCAPALAALLLLAVVVPARAADPPAGIWRVTIPVPTQRGQQNLSLLVMFSESEGKWLADFLDSNLNLKAEPTIDLTVNMDLVRFTLKFGPNTWTFDGKVSGKRIKGSLDLGGDLLLVDLVPSALKTFKDQFAVNREVLDTADTPADFFNALFPVVGK